jgi:serine/threonine-protein kinase
MGAVYEAAHIDTGVPAAVKVLLSNLEEDKEVRLRFELEIKALKQLHHPNIVRLVGSGEEQEVLYYVMELVDGPSLQHELKKQRLFTWQETAKIGLDMCQALRHAHDRGVTHRDIKPANILLTQDGCVKLSDYGIAQNFGASRITGTHSIVGTLEYMSPEQAMANPIGPRSDLFSLGAVLYLLLTGKVPFHARSLPELIRKHTAASFDPIKMFRFDVPADFEAIIADLLRPRPEDRPANAYLIVKRFQAMLHALAGSPESIRVLPMTAAAIQPPPIPAETPLNPYQNRNIHAAGAAVERETQDFIVDDGIVDLSQMTASVNKAAGSVQEAEKESGTPTPVPADAPNSDATLEYTPTDMRVLERRRGIRHGEVLLMDTAALRRSKDEPLPSVKSFGNITKTQEQDKANADAGAVPLPAIPAEHTAEAEINIIRAEADALSNPGTQHSGMTGANSTRENTHKTSAGSSFVEVTDDQRHGLPPERTFGKPIISVSTVLTSLALLVIGITLYYLLQPVPPDKLYERIAAVLKQDNSPNGYSLSTLRAAQSNIERFLAEYPHHSLAQQVSGLHDELELAENERLYTRQQFLSAVRRLSPVEIAYVDAITVSRTDLQRGAEKMQAFIELFDDAADKSKAETKRLSSHVEICVELAKRRLKKIEHELSLQSGEQTEVIRNRLLAADELESTNPDRAQAIRRAVIVLYQNYSWAEKLVGEAKKDYQESPTAHPDRTVSPETPEVP